MISFRFDKKTDELFNAILQLDNLDEAEAFFRDLCTIDELKVMSERLQIAKMVFEGMSYRKISEKLGVSTTTISRVALWLNNGEDGYKTVFDKQGLKNKSLAE